MVVVEFGQIGVEKAYFGCSGHADRGLLFMQDRGMLLLGFRKRDADRGMQDIADRGMHPDVCVFRGQIAV